MRLVAVQKLLKSETKRRLYFYILERFKKNGKTVSLPDVSKKFNSITKQAISQHLLYLQLNGFLESRQEITDVGKIKLFIPRIDFVEFREATKEKFLRAIKPEPRFFFYGLEDTKVANRIIELLKKNESLSREEIINKLGYKKGARNIQAILDSLEERKKIVSHRTYYLVEKD